MKAQDWIKRLELQAHPEGGYYKETYRCNESLTPVNLPQRFEQSHCFSTAIYYLLEAPQFSAFHRIKQDEVWHFYHGSTLTIHVININGKYLKLKLGNNPKQGCSFQHVIQAGDWFAASVDDPTGFSLVGCTVAPGFEFTDFELAKRNQLIELFPKHHQIIKQLTR